MKLFKVKFQDKVTAKVVLRTLPVEWSYPTYEKALEVKKALFPIPTKIHIVKVNYR